MRKPILRFKFSTAAGFGLVEVMIGSLVISIGLLGMIMLQANSMKAIQTAYYSTMANAIAQEFITRLQLNPLMLNNGYQAAGNNNYLQLFVNDPIDVTYSSNTLSWYNAWYAAQTSSCYTGANFCTPFDLAQTDKADVAIYAWGQLPSGRIKVCFDSSNPTTFTCDNNRVNAESTPGTVGLSVFTVKLQWTNIAGSGNQYFQTKFTYNCTNAAGC